MRIFERVVCYNRLRLGGLKAGQELLPNFWAPQMHFQNPAKCLFSEPLRQNADGYLFFGNGYVGGRATEKRRPVNDNSLLTFWKPKLGYLGKQTTWVVSGVSGLLSCVVSEFSFVFLFGGVVSGWKEKGGDNTRRVMRQIVVVSMFVGVSSSCGYYLFLLLFLVIVFETNCFLVLPSKHLRSSVTANLVSLHLFL